MTDNNNSLTSTQAVTVVCNEEHQQIVRRAEESTDKLFGDFLNVLHGVIILRNILDSSGYERREL